jgi:2-keto-4-pentenoate hydratase/2-oxohepta-3-ene-1,7-dioic acid hydratase in catechol pathway
MRLATARRPGAATELGGIVEDDTLHVVQGAGRWPDLAAYLAAPDRAALAAAVDGAIALDELELLPVVPRPAKVLCVGLNFETHRRETGRDATAHPTIFTRFADTLVGHDRPLVLPRASDRLDYEGEIALVVGRPARAVAPADALDVVAGYTLFQDATLRDFQNHTGQFTPGKNFPATGGLGPVLVTADEVGDPRALELTTTVNGEERQRGRLDDLTFDVPAIVAYCSTWTVLAPGDVIAIGTPGGIGSRMDPPRWLAAGDVVEVAAPGLGVLRNPVAAESAQAP